MRDFERRLKRLEQIETPPIFMFELLELQKAWRKKLTPKEAQDVDYAKRIRIEVSRGRRQAEPENDPRFNPGKALLKTEPTFPDDHPITTLSLKAFAFPELFMNG